MGDYTAALETENRKLRTSVKKEVADNYDKLINRIDHLNEKLAKQAEQLKEAEKALEEIGNGHLHEKVSEQIAYIYLAKYKQIQFKVKEKEQENIYCNSLLIGE